MIFSANYIMAKTMNKRSGRKHKRSGHKRSKRTERKGKKGTLGYRKGSKSKTMKGKKDFTTKKSSKVFNRRRHYQKHAKGSRVIRRPYHKKGGSKTELVVHELHNAYPSHMSRFHKNPASDHPGLPGTLGKGSTKPGSENLNIIMPHPNTAILTNNVTKNSSLTAMGLIEAINDTLQNDYVDKIPGGSYPQEWLIQGGNQVVLNSSYSGPVKGSFYKNNEGMIPSKMQAELEKNPPLRREVGGVIADYLKKEGGLASNSPITNTAKHWADSLA